MVSIDLRRDGVDPVSRCTRCGAAVAAEGRADHLRWHAQLVWLLTSIAVSAGVAEWPQPEV